MSGVFLSILVLGGTGLVFSLLLALLSKKLKVKENPLTTEILNILPGINCGACGFSGCLAFAQAVIKEKKIFNGCLPGGEELNKNITNLLGIDSEVSRHKSTAACHCAAKEGEKKASSQYNGIKTCQAANITGGVFDCVYSCLAWGDCVNVCPVKAISLNNKKIAIDSEKCISCGKCVPACPRDLFKIIPINSVKEVFSNGINDKNGINFVACNNKETGKNVTAVCSKGCIACEICVRVKDSPFYIKNNLSYIDYSKIGNVAAIQEAKSKCPTKCII